MSLSFERYHVDTRLPKPVLQLLFQLRSALELNSLHCGFQDEDHAQRTISVTAWTKIWRETYPLPALDALIEWGCEASGAPTAHATEERMREIWSNTLTGSEGTRRMHERLDTNAKACAAKVLQARRESGLKKLTTEEKEALGLEGAF